MEIYRKNARTQYWGTCFVRACAIETHMDMSQEISQEPVCMEIYRKNPHTLSEEHVLYGNFQGKRTWTWTFQKNHVVLKLTGKMPDPNSGEHLLCGNLEEKTYMEMSLRAILCDKHRASVPYHKNPLFSVATLFWEKQKQGQRPQGPPSHHQPLSLYKHASQILPPTKNQYNMS